MSPHTLTHMHTLSLQMHPLPLLLLYAHMQRHYTNALANKPFPYQCNMSRHVHTASHLDVTALPGHLCYIKNPFLSLSKLQADGGESAWLSLRSRESCFFFSLLVYFGIYNFLLFSPCTERISLIYSMTHLCEGARFFAASHHISSLSQGWYFCVNLCSQTH